MNFPDYEPLTETIFEDLSRSRLPESALRFGGYMLMVRTGLPDDPSRGYARLDSWLTIDNKFRDRAHVTLEVLGADTDADPLHTVEAVVIEDGFWQPGAGEETFPIDDLEVTQGYFLNDEEGEEGEEGGYLAIQAWINRHKRFHEGRQHSRRRHLGRQLLRPRPRDITRI